MNEHEWAEEMISAHSLGQKPFETFCRVARYYLDSGMPKAEVRRLLDAFLLQCEPTASIPKWSDALDRALNVACRRESVNLGGIDITEREMARIDALQGRQLRRLAFTLLCLAKYWNAVLPGGSGWVNNKDSEIMRMANINTSIRRQSAMYHALSELGMIRFSKKVDNTNVCVMFLEPGEPALHITDFRNLGYQYLMYHGEPYFECKNCGIVTKYTNPDERWKQKYCRVCAAQVILQQNVNAVMSYKARKRGRPVHQEEDTRNYKVYMHVFPDGKVYIGMTRQELCDRWRNGSGYPSDPMYSAIRSVGWGNIKHYILFDGLDRDSAFRIESYMIHKKRATSPRHGYNLNGDSRKQINAEIVPNFQMVEVDGNGAPIVCTGKKSPT